MSYSCYLRSRRVLRTLIFGLSLSSLPAMAAETAEHGHAGHATEKQSEARGPHGGAVTRDGSDEVELAIMEGKGKSLLQIWGRRGGKAVPPGELQATATLHRPGAAPEKLALVVSDGMLVSRDSIEEPHFFDIDVEISWPGRAAPLRAELHKDEGLIALSAPQIAAAGIRTRIAGNARLAASVKFPGEVKFNADRTAHVVPRASGVAQAVSADLGQAVRKGDLLATISSPALSEMRSEWLSAVKRHDLAQSAYRREEKLWREQVSAEQDYQQARTALQETQIAVQNAEQKLRAIGAESESRDLSLLEVRAPFDGIVVEKHIALGEAVDSAANIFTISDLNTVWAEFVVSPKDLPMVRVGEQAEVATSAFEGKAQGTVSYIGALLGQQTRTAAARVTLGNPDMSWRPGLFVSVDVVVHRSDVAVAVPADAIQTVEDKPTLFIEAPGGFLPQPVVLGKSSGDQVEVLSGLQAGARYVSENAFVLKSEMGKSSAEHTH